MVAGGCTADIPSANSFDPEAPATLQETAEITGRVTVEEGGAALGARVTVSGPTTVTLDVDDDGAFEIRDLRPGDYEVAVQQTGYARFVEPELRLAVGERLSLGEVRLDLLRASLTGTVRVDGSEDHSGVAVSLTSVTDDGAISQALRPAQDGEGETDVTIRRFGTITDLDGEWTFDGVPVGLYRVIATLPDHTRFCRDLVEISAENNMLRIDSVMRLLPASAVVRLVDALGRPLTVTNQTSASAELRAFGAVDVRYATDPDALAAQPFAPFTESLVEDLPLAEDGAADGPLSLFVQFRDTCELESPVYEATVLYDATPPRIIGLTLENGAEFLRDPEGVATLEVDAADDSSGLAGMFVAVDDEDLDGEDGRAYALRSVIPLGAEEGPKYVTVRVIDRAGNLSDPGTVEIIKDTNPPVPGEVPLAIVEADAASVHSADVTLNLEFSGEPAAMSVRNQPGTEAGPWAAYEPVMAWRLAAGVDGPRTVYVRVRDAAGNTTDELSVTVALDTTAAVGGLVRLESLGFVAGVTVTAGGQSTTTDAAGAFELADLNAGFHSLTASHPGFSDTIIPFSANAGQRTDAGELFLTQARGTLAGVARYADRGTHEGVQIEVEGTPFAVLTSATGEWRLSGVPAGAVTVVASADGYGSVRWEERQVTGDQLTELEVLTLNVRQPSVRLDDADGVVGSREVDLWLAWPGAMEFELSEDPSFADPDAGDTGFRAFEPSASERFLLSEGEGPKTVYARFRDPAGEVSAVVSVDLLLDLTAPVGTVRITGAFADSVPSNEVIVDLTSAAVTLDTDDASAMWLTTGAEVPDCDTADWGTPRAEVEPFSLVAADGLATAWLCLRDIAGNVGGPFTATIAHDASAPSECSVQLTGRGADGLPRSGATASRTVDVALGCAEAPAEAFLVAADVAPDCAAVPYEAFRASRTLELTSGDGAGKVAYACFRDAARNTAGPIVSAPVRLDTQAPSNLELTLADGRGYWNGAEALGAGHQLPVSASAGEAGTFRLYLDPERSPAVEGAFDPSEGPVDAAVTLPPFDGVHTVYLRVTDAVGNTSGIGQATIEVDTSAPTGDLAIIGRLADGRADRQTTSALTGLSVEVSTLGEASGMAVVTGTVAPDCAAVEAYGPLAPRVEGLTLTAEGGVARAWLCLTDAAGNTSTATEASIAHDATAPGECRVALEGRSAAGGNLSDLTASRTVTYTITCGDPPAQMALATAAMDCADATYVEFQPAGEFLLSAGDGPDKTLTACFRDDAGNTTAAVASNALVLDTTAPTGLSLVLHDGDGWWNGADADAMALDLPVTLSANEAGVFELSTDSSFETVVGGDYGTANVAQNTAIQLRDEPGALQSVFLRLRDAAGNVSAVLERRITVDTNPPVGAAVLAGGAEWLNASSDGTVALNLQASDAESSVAKMAVFAGDGDCPEHANFVPYAGVAAVTFFEDPASAEEGAYRASACFLDRAGNVAGPYRTEIELDRTLPVIESFGVDSVDGVVGDPFVTLALSIAQGDGAGLYGVALANASLDCASATYEPVTLPPNGDLVLPWVLSSDDSDKTVFVCLMDEAGNQSSSATGSDPVVTLDTTAPAAGVLDLAGGAAATREVEVAFSVLGGADATSVSLSGDLAEGVAGTYALDALSATVTLAANDGLKTVTAVFIDAAGNSSVPFSDSITLDTAAPATGTVTLAGGADEVTSQVIAVTIADTLADTMRFWETAAGCGACACGDATCSGAAASAFTPNTTVTLSGGEPGPRTVCWQFCDDAGNGSDVASADITLGTFINRPRPALSGLDPISHLALQQDTYELVIEGQGIAHDTEAQVGDFILDCEVLSADEATGELVAFDATDCEYDAATDGDDAPADAVNASCGTACRVTLDDIIMRNSGSYLVRLVTPDPVQGGLGTSRDEAFFKVVAPAPVINRVSPRGVTQVVNANGTPRGQTIEPLKVWGQYFMDNVSISIGGVAGQVLRMVDDPDEGAQGRYAEVVIRTDGLFPSDLEDESITAENPAPGGGSFSFAFGLNPEATDCLAYPCVSNLRATRVRSPDGNFVYQDYRLQNFPANVLFFRGATAASALAANGTVLARVEAQNESGVLPLPAAFDRVRLEDSRGTYGRVVLGPASTVPGGTPMQVGGGAGTPGGGTASSMQAGDFDNDGSADIMMVFAGRSDVSIYRNPYAPGGGERFDIETADEITTAVLADMNGDGNLDIVAGHEDDGIVVRLGNGDFTFAPPASYRTRLSNIRGMALGDLNKDGNPDIVYAEYYGGFRVRFGKPNGTFGSEDSGQDNPNFEFGYIFSRQDFFDSRRPSDLELADLNGDGSLDLVMVGGDGHGVLFNDGDGQFLGYEYVQLDGYAGASEVIPADLNGDGALDLVFRDGFTFYTRLWTGSGQAGFGNRGSGFETDATSLSDVAQQFVLAELTGDGLLDIFLGNRRTSSHTVIIPGNGDGSFSFPEAIYLNQESLVATAVDINDDGSMDVGGLSDTGEFWFAVSRTRPLGGSTFIETGSQVQDIEPIDFDIDGDMDAIISFGNDTGFGVYAYENDGLGNLSQVSRIATGKGVSRSIGDIMQVAVADFDLDGFPDVAFATNWNQVTVFHGAGNGTFAGGDASTANNTGIYDPTAEDVNNDGYPDLVFSGIYRDSDNNLIRNMVVLANNGLGQFDYSDAATVDISVDSNGANGIFRDLNGDGLVDLMIGAAANDQARIALQEAGYVFDGVFNENVSYRPSNLTAHDFTGDGFLDIVSCGGNQLRLNPGAGDGTFDATIDLIAVDSCDTLDAADMDGDGVMDIVADNTGSSEMRYLYGARSGAGTSVERVTAISLDERSRELRTFDINGDGRPDVLNGMQTGVLVRYSDSRQWPLRLGVLDEDELQVPAEDDPETADDDRILELKATASELFAEVVGLRLNVSVPPGESIDGLRILLTTPEGETVLVDDTASADCPANWNGDQLVAIYPTTAPCDAGAMAALVGWHDAGDWTVTLENMTGQPLSVNSYSVLLTAYFNRPNNSGLSKLRPQRIELGPDRAGAVVPARTFGGNDDEDLGCGDGAGAPDTHFELYSDRPQWLTTRAVGQFDSQLAVSKGRCSSAVDTRCAGDLGSSRNPMLAGRFLDEGWYCIAVDGDGGPGVAGRFDLTVQRGDSVCDVVPDVSSALNQGTVQIHTDVAADELAGSCGDGASNEVVVAFTAPETTNYVVHVLNGVDFDTVLSVRTGCGDVATELQCEVSPLTSFDGVAGETYYVVVEGTAGESGEALLSIAY